MRKGQHSLSLHLAMIGAELARQGAGAMSVEHNKKQKPLYDEKQLAAMLKGMQRYHTAQTPVRAPPLTSMWTEGQVQLMRLSDQPFDMQTCPILLIPSLVNRSGVFNLTESHSVMRQMQRQGYDPVLLDWGESCRDLGQCTLEGIITKRLVPSVAYIEKTYGQKPHIVGYCMGGTLLACALSACEVAARTAVFLATPWAFHEKEQGLHARIAHWRDHIMTHISQHGQCKQGWLHSLFASLDPLSTVRKFAAFHDLAPGDPQETLFIAVEDWLNDGVDLPELVIKECVQLWFEEDHLARGLYGIGGQLVQASRVSVPSLIVASHTDRLVPFESASSLYNSIPGAALCTPKTGHIGMITGRRAAEEVWAPIEEFFAYCNPE